MIKLWIFIQEHSKLTQSGRARSLLSYGRELLLEKKLEQAEEQFDKVKKFKKSQNPFTVGQPVPPERFVGRESEIATAFDQIYSRSNLAIWGGPGVGKSSFLEYLASPQVWYEQGLDPSQAVIVCLNCLSIFPFRPSAFWREVLSLMKEELEGDAGSKIDELLGQAEVTKDNLRQVVRQIGRQNKFLVLLLDDYDAVVRPHDEYTEADIE